ncbi:alpha-ketoglutarate decarboxylase [Winogradskyella litoriviva]|uniref:Alpha-ketoglutarate decarboxylase n=1 Tax=Winogradskyella litoriviva TaxID=1220182 RepID=A0ABX2E7N8_9FLAO|nr:alpha-ketoglutarate decarboxylase [Winogradskyella litoriviva]NRD24347.1 alpha-ketoglutarate decarboxylase [Winogradskyella litoriviva]
MTISYSKHFNNNKTKLSILILCFFTLFSFAQDAKTKSTFWNNVEFGGGLGLNFGNGFFSTAVSPNALYRFSPYIATGVGLNFSYSSQKDFFKSTVLGGSVIGLFNPYEQVQLSTEFEQLHVSRNFDERYVSNSDDDYWYPALFLGVGYSSNNVTFGIRYDVLYDKDKSIYSEAWMPFVRFYF